MTQKNPIAHAAFGALAMLLALTACTPSDGPGVITDVRVVTGPRPAEKVGATSAERFGAAGPAVMPGAEMGASPAMPGAAEEQPPASPYAWEAPAGWQAAPATAMRLANFTIGPAVEAECYLAILRGDGGGLEANVNRWRAQMGIEEALDASAVAQLPTLEILGGPATLVEATGTDAKAGALLVAAIRILPDSSVFVKMVGPREIVEAEREHFAAFCRSIRPAEAPLSPQGEAGTLSSQGEAP